MTCNRLFERYQITFQEGTEQNETVCEAFKTGTENMKQANKSVLLCSNSTVMNLQLGANRRLLDEEQIKICLCTLGFRHFLTMKSNG